MSFANPGKKLNWIIAFIFWLGVILIIVAAYYCMNVIDDIVDILSAFDLVDNASRWAARETASIIVIIAAVISLLWLYILRLVFSIYGDIDDQLNRQTEIQAQIMESLEQIERNGRNSGNGG